MSGLILSLSENIPELPFNSIEMQDINDYFPFILNSDQKTACESMLSFFDNNDQVFLLTGYAGTGKTTILGGMLDYLDEIKRPYELWATTGRAAKVLGNITGRQSKTIHSAIYILDNQTSKLDEENKKLSFKLRTNSSDEDTIYFVDEASMISDRVENNQMLLFEDGRFMEHLFNYVSHRKLVFIGDTAQLPPVNCDITAALDSAYIESKYQKQCITVLLKEVMRQQLHSGILWNATQLRTRMQPPIPPLAIRASGFPDVDVEKNTWTAVSDFVVDMKKNGIGNAVFIAASNGSVHYLNSQIRNNYYGKPDLPLQKGDLLMVIQNNFHYDLANGQSVKLLDFDPKPIKQHSLTFIDALVEIPETAGRKQVMLLMDILHRKEPNLTLFEENELMKNFVIRMREKRIKPKSDAFINHFLSDPFINSLRVKYSYAITCHKAQGGEWNRVYVGSEPAMDYFSRDYLYRWHYTAITRAKQNLIFTNSKYLY